MKSAEQLNIEEKLQKVPQGGVVADIGSGFGLSLTSYVFSSRPDLSVVSIDPAYVERRTFDPTKTADLYEDPCRQLLLKGNHKWLKKMVSAYCEELPIASESVDLAVSYAVVPNHVFNPVKALNEIVRTLKPSGELTFGPFSDDLYEDFETTLREVVALPSVQDWSIRSDEMTDAYGDQIDVYFADLTKAA